jgi:hypothetical protein
MTLAYLAVASAGAALIYVLMISVILQRRTKLRRRLEAGECPGPFASEACDSNLFLVAAEYELATTGRTRLYRRYMRSLNSDFELAYSEAKLRSIYSEGGRTNIKKTLLKQRVIFKYAVFLVHCRLALLALSPGTWSTGVLFRATRTARNKLPEIEGAGVAGIGVS